MLALPGDGFVLLSMPKCASTSLEAALAPRADVVLRRNPGLKHIGCRGFYRHLEPLLKRTGYPRDDYELVTLFREPIAWLDSWWRYRSRPGLRRRDSDSFAGDMGFEEYAERYMAGGDDGPVVSGRPARFITRGPRFTVGLDRVFALEASDVWSGWIEEKVGAPVEVARHNRSTVRAGTEVPDSLRRRLEEHFALEYDVYERLRATGQWSEARGTVLKP